METMTILATGWSVVRPDGTVVTNTEPGATEEYIWWKAYYNRSWIEAAKSHGARVARCEVRKIGGEG